MGQCFSFTRRRGRKNFQIGVVQKSFNSVGTGTGTGKSSTYSASRKATYNESVDEFEVERVSGYFSVEEYSPKDAADHVEKPHPHNFGWHLAQEKKRDSFDRTKPEKNRAQSPARPPAMLSRPQAMPSSKINVHLKSSPGYQLVQRESLDRKPSERTLVESKPSERYLEAERALVARKPPDRKPPERTSTERKPPERKPPEKTSAERKYPERNPEERKPTGRKPVERTGAERKYPERNPEERKPTERKPAERTGSASVADAMNRKGRLSLEMIRGSTPERTNSVKMSRPSKNGRESASQKSLPAGGSRQSQPVDFGFLAKQFATVESPRHLSKSRNDREPRPVLAELKDPAAGHVRRDSLTRQEIDDVAKTYRESAAKAAARDRDSFKSMGEDTSLNSSLGDSVGSGLGASRDRDFFKSTADDTSINSSHGDFVASKLGASPSAMPRRYSHSRNASFPVEPEPEITESPVNLATLLKDADDRLRIQARGTSPVMPKPTGVTRNRTFPSPRRYVPSPRRAVPSPGRSMRAVEARPGEKYENSPLASKLSNLAIQLRLGRGSPGGAITLE